MRGLRRMSPERWMVAAFAGIGVYAIYRLAIAPKGPTNTFDSPPPPSPPPSIVRSVPS